MSRNAAQLLASIAPAVALRTSPPVDRDAVTEPPRPSDRPTPSPDAGWGLDSVGLMADSEGFLVLAELTIPRRIGAPSANIDVRTAFVFRHIDGVSTIEEIARFADLPVVEVVREFVRLVELGVVELSDAMPEVAPPVASGIFPRLTDKDVTRGRR